MLNNLLNQTEHGRTLVSVIERAQRQNEDNARQAVFNCFGVGTAGELKRIVLEAQGIGAIFNTAAQSSGLEVAQKFGEIMREAKTFGGVPTETEVMREAERINSSPVQKIYRELKQVCEQANRENKEAEQRESLQSIVRNHQKEMAAQFARPMPHFEIEPVRLSKPIKLTLEINVHIIPKNNQSDADGVNPSTTN